MRNSLCWNPRDVRRVINPFAEHINDSLFRAVHIDWPLRVSPPVGKSFQDIAETSWWEMSPREFLEDFLRQDRPHSLAAILGETGSGKSHLVHWMRLHIKSDKHRLVVVVRKSGTSLRNIVKMLINELPAKDRQPFLDALQAAGDMSQDRESQKHQLLNDIAQVIREEKLSPEADEIERELVNYLPYVFQDPHMRAAHFLADNTIISDIVDHIFAPSNAHHRPDVRRRFTEDDLPLGGNDFVNASKHARDAMQIIQTDAGNNLPLACKIVDRNLDRAVSRTLSFSGDRIEELMVRLRTHLKQEGRELVLLIEEFARLQGIDRALLQAITTHGDQHQCTMRTAIAVTTGFFGSVAETAYMRTTHIVDMDHSVGRRDGGKVAPETLSQFAARYLNAVRLGPEAIDRWSDRASPGEDPPSSCASCIHQAQCHDIFGEVDGYGLYPFTQTALWNGALRVDRSMPEKVNPRILQNNLLVEVLDNHGPLIEQGAFPPKGLIEKFGGVKALSATQQHDLKQRNGHVADRWVAFLELYDGGGKIRNLDRRLHEALGVPEIPDAAHLPDEPYGGQDPEPQMPPTVSNRSREEIAIDRWVNGGILDEQTANELRKYLFQAISDAIDWDGAGLAKAHSVGKGGRPFQQTSINFDRQATRAATYIAVKLDIPGELVGLEMAGAALQGLLRASKSDFQWDFENGDVQLSAFLNCLEIWIRHVLNQLLQISNPTPQWSQAAAGLELLCIGAAIGGKIRPDANIADMIDAAFSRWPEECVSQSREMQALYSKLSRARSGMREMVRAQISSMKGGQVGKMLDPVKVTEPIQRFRRNRWRPELQPPESDRGEIASAYRDIKATLETAVRAECTGREAWLSQMDEAFGEYSNRATIADTLEKTVLAVGKAGIAAGGKLRALADALERFRGVHFDDARSAVRALARQDNGLAVLPYLGRGRQNAMLAGKELAEAASAFLDAVDGTLSTVSQSVDAAQEGMMKSIHEINVSLCQLETDLLILANDSGDGANVA